MDISYNMRMELESRRKTWDKLGALDLSHKSISAVINPVGEFQPVGDIRQKIEALRTRTAARQVEFLILGEFSNGETDPNRRMVLEWAAEYRLPCFFKKTLADTIDFIYEQDTRRRALHDKALQDFMECKLAGLEHVPADDQYQALSMLQPVSNAELAPSAYGIAPGYIRLSEWKDGIAADGPEQAYGLITPVEELMRRPADQEPSARRMILLGQNNTGKTWFLKYAARQAADGKLRCGENPLLPVRFNLDDWERWAADKPEADRYDLARFLAWEFDALDPKITREYWQVWLDQGELILLIDNLDKISKNFLRNYWSKALEKARRCPMMMACRTDSFTNYKQTLQNYQKIHLFSLTRAQQLSLARLYFGDEVNQLAIEQYLDNLSRLPGMDRSLSEPRMLPILLRAARAGGFTSTDRQTPARLTEVFREMLDSLLGIPSSQPDEPSLPERMDALHKQRLLEGLAFEMLLQEWKPGEGVPFDTVLNALRLMLVDQHICEEPESWKLALMVNEDLEKNTGLLFSDNGDQFQIRFLNAPIQQYLAACHILRWVERGPNPDWETPLPSLTTGKKHSPSQLVDLLAWQDDQQGVLGFLAGQLNDPEELLDRVRGKDIDKGVDKDDLFYHRRALVVDCLNELPITSVNLLVNAGEIEALIYDLFYLWFEAGNVIEEKYIQRAIVSLSLWPTRYDGRPLDSYLSGQLQNIELDEVHKRKLLKTFTMIRALPLSGAVSTALCRMLSCPPNDSKVAKSRQQALEAIRALGSCAATPEIIESLFPLLAASKDSFLEWQALAAMGPAAKLTPGQIAEVVRWLEYDFENKAADPRQADRLDVILAAIRNLGIGQESALLPVLFRIIRDSDQENERCLACCALAETSPDSLEEDDLQILLDQIHLLMFCSFDHEIRESAQMAVVRLYQGAKGETQAKLHAAFSRSRPARSSAPSQEGLDRFLEDLRTLLKTEDTENVTSIGEKIGLLTFAQLSTAAKDADLMQLLLSGMRSKNQVVRNIIHRFFSQLARAAPHEGPIDQVLEILNSGSATSRALAAAVLGFYGQAAARRNVLETLKARLDLREKEGVVYETARALKSMGANAASHKGMLEALALRLEAGKTDEPEETAQILSGRLPGQPINTAEVLAETLAELIAVSPQPEARSIAKGSPLDVLLRKMDLLKPATFPPEVSILHRQGLRLFHRADGFKVTPIKDLCNESQIPAHILSAS